MAMIGKLRRVVAGTIFISRVVSVGRSGAGSDRQVVGCITGSRDGTNAFTDNEDAAAENVESLMYRIDYSNYDTSAYQTMHKPGMRYGMHIS